MDHKTLKRDIIILLLIKVMVWGVVACLMVRRTDERNNGRLLRGSNHEASQRSDLVVDHGRVVLRKV